MSKRPPLQFVQAVNYEDIPQDIAESREMDNKRRTGLYSIQRDSAFGQWLVSQGFVFSRTGGTWDWIAIWN